MSSEGKPPEGSSQPDGGSEQTASPAATTSDLEKNAKVEEAKARVVAARAEAQKTAAGAPGSTPGPPRAPVKKKEEGPKPVDASGHRLVKKLRAKFKESVTEATEFLGQLSMRIEPSRIVEVCDALKLDRDAPFNYLSDLTAVHYPDRTDAPFEVIYNLYSISANERVRLKVAVTDTDGVESVTSVWPSADWPEREVYDLFGVRFRNHPDLRRILLPPDWEGHPLRKDYPLEAVENSWTRKHLPEFTDVQREQLEQRRAYGLEVLSVQEERRVRELFRSGKEVMPKDK
jgi:NADH-quinone oxidoreductase subunit C